MIALRRTDDLQRLAIMHALSAAADAFFTVSLADSLFFNVSVEAARPRLLLYLALTMAPFALLAPLIGPFIDRVRGGQRTALVATMVGRAALTLALVNDLRSLLMFPEAFGVLVLGKAYSISRNATVPRLIADDAQLVSANAFLARIGLVASFVGGGVATVALSLRGASLALSIATVLLVVAGLVAFTIRSPAAAPRRPTRLEYHELHAVTITRAVDAVGLLRGAVGLLTFLFGFELKRSGAPLWQFGLVLVGGGIGAMAATLISPRMRRRFPEQRILVFVMAAAALVAIIGVLQFSVVTAVVVSATVGAAASTGKHVFDALVQRSAPDANMARAFAGFETRFQLFWIGGATLAVLTQADARLGLLVLGIALAVGAVAVDVSMHESDRYEGTPTLVAAVTQLVLEDAPHHDAPLAVLDAAEALARAGAAGGAVIAAAAALDAHRDVNGTDPGDTTLDEATALLRALRLAVTNGQRVASRDVQRALDVARVAVEAHPGVESDRGA